MTSKNKIREQNDRRQNADERCSLNSFYFLSFFGRCEKRRKYQFDCKLPKFARTLNTQIYGVIYRFRSDKNLFITIECDVICLRFFLPLVFAIDHFDVCGDFCFVLFCTFEKTYDNRTGEFSTVCLCPFHMCCCCIYGHFVSVYAQRSAEMKPFLFQWKFSERLLFILILVVQIIALFCLLLSLLLILKWIFSHPKQTDSQRICIANQTTTDRTVVNGFIESNCIELIYSAMTTTTKSQSKSENEICFARSSFKCALLFFNRKIDKIVPLKTKWIEWKKRRIII